MTYAETCLLILLVAHIVGVTIAMFDHIDLAMARDRNWAVILLPFFAFPFGLILGVPIILLGKTFAGHRLQLLKAGIPFAARYGLAMLAGVLICVCIKFFGTP